MFRADACHRLWVQVLVCPLGVGRKVIETMSTTQCFPPGQVWQDQFCQEYTGRTAWQIQTAIHRNISRLCSALHGRFSFYSDKKGLYAAQCYPELRW